MNIRFTGTFKKLYKKSPDKIRKAFDARLPLFLNNPLHPLLNNHQLKGRLSGLRSINITGDCRALFSEDKSGDVVFELIGNHSQLYGK